MKLLQFKRITSAGNFIPEIDGIRFVAILSVVVFHLGGFIHARDVNHYSFPISMDWLKIITDRGHIGVPLFFVLSGMILGLPFAKHYLQGAPKVVLKNYFLRRLTRLEPPYILALTLLLAGSVWVAKNLTADEALPSYFSSVFYVHNILYGKEVLPLINCVTWSLEVEVQFYILAPLLASVFNIKSTSYRRLGIVISAIIFFILPVYIQLPFISLFDYLSYFLLGFLLADLYLISPVQSIRFKNAYALLCLTFMFSFDGNELNDSSMKLIWHLLIGFTLFAFCYLIIISKAGRLLSKEFFTHIGGMCYSIYLLHFSVISFLGGYLMAMKISEISFINESFYVVALLCAILLVSSFFYLLIERPCMKKDWYKSITLKNLYSDHEIR